MDPGFGPVHKNDADGEMRSKKKKIGSTSAVSDDGLAGVKVIIQTQCLHCRKNLR